MTGTIFLMTLFLASASTKAPIKKEVWQLQQSNVCFGAKNDTFGSFTLKYEGPLLGLKLLHISGFVSCNAHGQSYWGCHNSRYISIAITDEENRVVLPEDLDTKGLVIIPGYDVDSKEVVLDDGKKINVNRGTRMRLWYGEDLRNFEEEDNFGSCCVDVFAKLTGEMVEAQNEVWVPQMKNLCLNQTTSAMESFPLLYSGTLGAVKVVRRFEQRRCSVRRRSRYFPSCTERSKISIMIGYANDIILFPQVKKWVPLPPYSGKSSGHIILENQNLTKVHRGDMLTMWYSGIFTKEKTCLDVYSRITREHGILMIKLKFSIAIDIRNMGSKKLQEKLLLELTEYFNVTLAATLEHWRKLSDGYFIFDETKNISSILPIRMDMKSWSSELISEVTLDIYDSISPFEGSASYSPRFRFLLCGPLMKAALELKLTTFTVVGSPQVKSFSCCADDTFGTESFKGKYIAEAAPVDTRRSFQCKYYTNLTFSRSCGFSDGVAAWEQPNLRMCPPKSITTAALEKLSHMPHEEMLAKNIEIASELNQILSNASFITAPEDLTFIADITSIIVSNVNNSRASELADNVLDMYNTLLDVDPSLVVKAQNSNTAGTSLIKGIEIMSATMGRSLHPFRSTNVSTSKKKIALLVTKVPPSNINLVTKVDDQQRLSVGSNEGSTDSSSDILASVHIPASVLNISTDSNGDGVVHSHVYLEDTLFVDEQKKKSLDNGTVIGSVLQSLVLSVSFGNNVSILPDPILIQFKKNSLLQYQSVCSFWVFGNDAGVGKWDTTGCTLLNETLLGLVTCQCNHVTNFAIVMDVYQTASNPVPLQLVSWVGCITSLVGLAITIFIYVYFRSLRAKLPSKILICLCSSLSVFLLVFICGVERTSHRTLCQVVAGVLHYFILTSFHWMLVTAINLFYYLVLVFRRTNEVQFFKYVSLFAWISPLLIVFITAPLAPHQYGDENFCFPRQEAAYFGVLLPISIILMINMAIFVAIVVKFARSKPVGDGKEISNDFNQVRIAFTVTVLLGLTWSFAFFALGSAEFIFQLLFCIFNSFQGFLIFVLHTLTNTSVKKELRKAFRNTRFTGKTGLKKQKTVCTTDTNLSQPLISRKETLSRESSIKFSKGAIQTIHSPFSSDNQPKIVNMETLEFKKYQSPNADYFHQQSDYNSVNGRIPLQPYFGSNPISNDAPMSRAALHASIEKILSKETYIQVPCGSSEELAVGCNVKQIDKALHEINNHVKEYSDHSDKEKEQKRHNSEPEISNMLVIPHTSEHKKTSTTFDRKRSQTYHPNSKGTKMKLKRKLSLPVTAMETGHDLLERRR